MSSPNLDHDLGTIEPLPAATLHAARLTIADRARDAEDAALLMAALGLEVAG